MLVDHSRGVQYTKKHRLAEEFSVKSTGGHCFRNPNVIFWRLFWYTCEICRQRSSWPIVTCHVAFTLHCIPCHCVLVRFIAGWKLTLCRLTSLLQLRPAVSLTAGVSKRMKALKRLYLVEQRLYIWAGFPGQLLRKQKTVDLFNFYTSGVATENFGHVLHLNQLWRKPGHSHCLPTSET